MKWPTLFMRKVDPEKIRNASVDTIFYLTKDLKLQPYECRMVLETLLKTFPEEDSK